MAYGHFYKFIAVLFILLTQEANCKIYLCGLKHIFPQSKAIITSLKMRISAAD